MIKRWRTGLIEQDTPQPPIGRTQHVLNHFAGDPTYDEDACQRPIRKHVRHHTWNTSTPTYEEYPKCLRAPKNNSAGPDGVPPHLLRHLPNHIRKQLYQAIIAVWNGQNIPVAWLRSRVVLIYKKKDPQDPRNYRPIYVSTAIYSILTRLLLMRISRAMTPRLLDIQRGALQGRNTMTLATNIRTHRGPKWVTRLETTPTHAATTQTDASTTNNQTRRGKRRKPRTLLAH